MPAFFSFNLQPYQPINDKCQLGHPPLQTVATPSDIDFYSGSSSSPNEAPAVLIIDDDDAIRALAQWVAQRAGYSALTARDGPEGLETYQHFSDRIGLILLDLTMPRMTGGEVVSALRALPTNVPVVLITGYGEDAVRDDEKIGISGVLQKPFTADDLRAVLDRYLKNLAASGASTSLRPHAGR